MTPLEAARLAVGLVELACPSRLGRAILGHHPDARERAAMRILGARRLGQYVAARRGRRLLGGPALDAVHAASMVWLAAVSERYRRAALTSAGVAAAFAVAAAR